MKRMLLVSMLGVGLGLLASSCANYRLGSMLPADLKTISIPVFVNRTSEPRLEVETTQALVEEMQRDGSLKVVNGDVADCQLAVTLLGYTLEPVAYRTDQRTSAREYRIVIRASIMLTRRSTGAVVVENPKVVGEATFPVQGDLTSSKRRGLPLASADLAHNIVEQIVEFW